MTKKYQFILLLDLCRTEWLHDAGSPPVWLNFYLVVPSKSGRSSEADVSGEGRSSWAELHMLMIRERSTTSGDPDSERLEGKRQAYSHERYSSGCHGDGSERSPGSDVLAVDCPSRTADLHGSEKQASVVMGSK
jgi:hypothetical protein